MTKSTNEQIARELCGKIRKYFNKTFVVNEGHDPLVPIIKTILDAKDEAAATAMGEAKRLQADVDGFWAWLAEAYEIEPREHFEKEAEDIGFSGPLQMAAHFIWKREPKVAEARSKAFDDAIEACKRVACDHGGEYMDDGSVAIECAEVIAALTAAKDDKK